MNPLVSVITPIYNMIENEQAEDFHLMVQLLELQTYPNIELLVIDGGSTDGTIDLLKDYKNKSYLNFFTEKDTGKFHALNKGAMRAKGKYVSFISCDDFYHDITAFQSAVELLEAENADYLFSPAYCRHPEGLVIQMTPAMYNAFQIMPCARQGMIFKRTMLEEERYFDDKYKLMADFDLIIRLVMKRRRAVFFDMNFTTYRLAEKPTLNEEQGFNELRHIFHKNYRSLYPMNDEVIEAMVMYSEFPQQLLERLSKFYAEEDREMFFERCEQVRQLRAQAMG